MKNKIILVLLLGLVGLLPLVGEETLVIDIDKAVSMAKDNNIDLKIATLELSGKRRDKNTAYNVFFPTVGASATYAKPNTKPSAASGLAEDSVTYGYEASFTFTPALFNAITLLKKDYELGKVTYEQAVIEMELSVKDVFYNIILLREQASLLEDNLKTIEARYDRTKLNYEAGLVSELDLLQTQVSLENFKPELSNVKNAYRVTLMDFKNLLGIDLEQDIVIDGQIDPEIMNITVDDAYNKALVNNMDLKKVDMTADFLEAKKASEFSRDFIPAMTISYGNAYNVQDPKNGSWSGLDDQGTFKLSLGYSFDALLPNSKQRMDLEKTKRSIKDINYKKDALLDGIRLNITNQINNLDNSLKIQKGLELTVNLAKKTLDMLEESYKSGTADLLEVENAENEYKKARVELLREKYNYTITSLKLNSIISGQ